VLIAEYLAVRHILTAPLIAARTAPYVREDDFDFEGLEVEKSTMSGGGALLVRIAFELWHAEKAVGLWELPRRLDASNFRRVTEALAIAPGSGGFPSPRRRNGWPPSGTRSGGGWTTALPRKAGLRSPAPSPSLPESPARAATARRARASPRARAATSSSGRTASSRSAAGARGRS